MSIEERPDIGAVVYSSARFDIRPVLYGNEFTFWEDDEAVPIREREGHRKGWQVGFLDPDDDDAVAMVVWQGGKMIESIYLSAIESAEEMDGRPV